MSIGQSNLELIIPINRGDPILHLDINDNGCLSGSSLGRVYFYPFLSKETVPSESDNRTVSIVKKRQKFSYLTKITKSSSKKSSDSYSQGSMSSSMLETNYENEPNNNLKEISQLKSFETTNNYNESGNINNIDTHTVEPPVQNSSLEIRGTRLKNKASSSESHIVNTRKCLMLNDRMDIPIKFVCLAANSAFVILENAQYFKWDLKSFEYVTVTLRDWTVIVHPKKLLIYKDSILIITDRRSLKLNLKSEYEQYVDITSLGTEIVPLDYNGNHVLSIFRDSTKKFSVIIRKVEVMEVIKSNSEYSSAKDHIKVDILEKPFINAACFWSPSRFIIIIRSKIIRVYNYNEESILDFTDYKGHKGDVVAIDASNSKYFLTISKDQTLKVWTSFSMKPLYSLSIKPASFEAGWPYFLKSYGKKILFSSDQGVFMTDLVISET